MASGGRPLADQEGIDPFHPARLSAERQEAEQRAWYTETRAAVERTNAEAVRNAESANRLANNKSVWLAETIATIKHFAFLSNMKTMKDHAELLTSKTSPKEVLTVLGRSGSLELRRHLHGR